jgi:hypothetical protein
MQKEKKYKDKIFKTMKKKLVTNVKRSFARDMLKIGSFFYNVKKIQVLLMFFL